MKITPYSIQYIMEQLRHGMIGALAYVGGSELFFNHPASGRDGECRSTFWSYLDDCGTLKFEVGLGFRVKSKPGENWRMIVAYEPNDTYTVWLLHASTSHGWLHAETSGEMIACVNNIKDEELQHVVESVYDTALKTRGQETGRLSATPELESARYYFKTS